MNKNKLKLLYHKRNQIWNDLLDLHSSAPEKTRVASSLSMVEILSVIYYGDFIKISKKKPNFKNDDVVIFSKGHGSLAIYPIFSDLGYFKRSYLFDVCGNGKLLGSIPEPNIPGILSINGSLGHGLGVLSGIAFANRSRNKKFFCFLGDGEMNEGSVWEAIMMIPQLKLKNIIAIVDSNKKSMLGETKDIIDLKDLGKKFEQFGWKSFSVDGHSIENLYKLFNKIKNNSYNKPIAIISNTFKGGNIKKLRDIDICHVISLSDEEVKTHKVKIK